MSLYIWPELETARHPLTPEDIGVVEAHAEFGYSYQARFNDERPYGELLLARVSKPSSSFVDFLDRPEAISPLQFIGYSLGIRAARNYLMLGTAESSGYQFTGSEMAHLRMAKGPGSRDAERASKQDPVIPFDELIKELFRVSGSRSTPESLIGYSVGVRNFRLEATRRVAV